MRKRVMELISLGGGGRRRRRTDLARLKGEDACCRDACQESSAVSIAVSNPDSFAVASASTMGDTNAVYDSP